MKIYGYSNAHAIGDVLKKPLIRTIGRFFSFRIEQESPPIVKITQLAWHFFKFGVAIIPFGACWLVGKTISFLSPTQIDLKGLHLKPPVVTIPEDVRADPKLNIYDIANQFAALNLPDSNYPSRSSSLELVCAIVTNRNDPNSLVFPDDEGMCQRYHNTISLIFPDDEEMRTRFYDDMELYLKAILRKLNSDDIDSNEKQKILFELADACLVCHPTWLQAASGIFFSLYQGQNVKEILLTMIQQYKESLIKEFMEQELNTEWHGLNSMRNIVGEDFGLQTVANRYDPYAYTDDNRLRKWIFRFAFLSYYENANRLIESVYTGIGLESCDPGYHDFLLKIVTSEPTYKIPQDKKNLTPADYVTETFFDEDCKINQKGVGVMLKQIGVLK